MWSDRLLPRYVYQKPFIVKFPEKCEWQNGFNADNKWGLVWYTEGSKTERGTSAGLYKWGLGRGHSFSLGLHTTVFQAEIYVFKACIMESTEKGYTGRSIFLIVRQPSRPLTSSR
jgi:hypothetical protein